MNKDNFLSIFSEYIGFSVKNINALTKIQLQEIVDWLEKLVPKIEFLDSTINKNQFKYSYQGWKDFFSFQYRLELENNNHYIMVSFSNNDNYNQEEYQFEICEYYGKRIENSIEYKTIINRICDDFDGCNIHTVINFIKNIWMNLVWPNSLDEKQKKEIKNNIYNLLKHIFKSRSTIYHYVDDVKFLHHGIEIGSWILTLIRKEYQERKFWNLNNIKAFWNDNIENYFKNKKSNLFILNDIKRLDFKNEDEIILYKLIYYYAHQYDWLFLEVLEDIEKSYYRDIYKYDHNTLQNYNNDGVWEPKKLKMS